MSARLPESLGAILSRTLHAVVSDAPRESTPVAIAYDHATHTIRLWAQAIVDATGECDASAMRCAGDRFFHDFPTTSARALTHALASWQERKNGPIRALYLARSSECP